MRVTTILTTIMDQLERVETKVDQAEERLSLVEETCSAVRAVVERIGARTTGMAKYGKVNACVSLR